MASTDARTWRAGYDLFRELTVQDFGAAPEGGTPEEAQAARDRVTQACREWFAANGGKD